MTGFSRRNFIKLCGGASALGLYGCATTKTSPDVAKVVVIGGGFGGATLSKYVKLIDASIHVTLVEPNPVFHTCPGSNNVIAGIADLRSLLWNYDTLKRKYGIEVVADEAMDVDPIQKTVRLKNGPVLKYDRLIVAPGIDFRWDAIEGYDQQASALIPHAWKAGGQTQLLRSQLEAMPDGGVVMILPPANPFRCPPGPYERASLIAYYLKNHKPRSKIIILDAKTKFSKQALFMQGWKDLYPGMIEWISWVGEGDIERIGVKSRTVFTEFGTHKADVLNIIPPQKAGAIAEKVGLTDQSGWCPIDQNTFESTLAPDIHVIGDACIATPMPKSGFSANAQAKTCALAIVNSINGKSQEQAALINTCYSYLNPDYAISVSAVYGYSNQERKLTTRSSGVTPMDADRSIEAKYARGWYRNITADTFL